MFLPRFIKTNNFFIGNSLYDVIRYGTRVHEIALANYIG